jgi:peptide methionine sulfoxide reductase MsrB
VLIEVRSKEADSHLGYVFEDLAEEGYGEYKELFREG